MKEVVRLKRFFFTLISGFIGIYFYNEYLNYKPIVKYETVYIDNLAKEFEGFTILQFGDLHGVRFGENQERLTSIINNLSFDMVAVVGDVIDRHQRDVTPFLELMAGIEADVPMFFVEGNVDEPSEVDEIRSFGLEMLDEPYTFRRNGSELIVMKYNFNHPLTEAYDHKTVVGLGHEPLPQDLGYDLILVGHYHGGQVRIPGYGAIFIPNIDGQRWFPTQSDVMGLQEFDGYTQSITAGLGASSSLKWFQKRWFNPPEINSITLSNKKIN